MALAIASLVCGIIGLEFDSPTLSALMLTISFIFWFAGVMAPDEEKYAQAYYSEEELRQAVMNACTNMEKGKNWNESCWDAFNSVAKVKKPWLIAEDGLKLPKERGSIEL